MPAKFHYGFLCDGAMKVAGKWTFQGVFDRIYSNKFPAAIPEAVLYFKFTGPVGPHVLRVQLTDSQGAPIGKEMRKPIECREFVDNDVLMNFKPLGLPKEGYFAFKLYLDEDKEPYGVVELTGTLTTQNMKPPGVDEE